MTKWPKVFFVEDERTLRLFAHEAFNFEKISHQVFADGCETINYFNQLLSENGTMPRIVFLDLFMPCMNGQEVYNTLTAEPYISHMQGTTLVITSAAEEALNIADHGLETRVLYKPYSVDALVDTVREIAPELIGSADE